MPLHVSSTMRSSSGGQNCITQQLVSSHSVGGCPVHSLREDCAPDGHKGGLCTGRPPTGVMITGAV